MQQYTGYTLLIVDDEETLRKAIAFDFKRRGFKVLTASNGTEALELARAEKVHLVLSDIRMPGGDGVELLEQIRAIHPSLPPLILMSGYSDINEANCIAKGALRVFTKPFERKELIDFICASLPPL